MPPERDSGYTPSINEDRRAPSQQGRNMSKALHAKLDTLMAQAIRRAWLSTEAIITRPGQGREDKHVLGNFVTCLRREIDTVGRELAAAAMPQESCSARIVQSELAKGLCDSSKWITLGMVAPNALISIHTALFGTVDVARVRMWCDEAPTSLGDDEEVIAEIDSAIARTESEIQVAQAIEGRLESLCADAEETHRDLNLTLNS